MDLDTLYKKIFPLGGVDDNNRYVDLTGDKINCVQLVEPALSISEFVLPDKDKTETDRPEKYAYRMPLISIDDHSSTVLVHGFTSHRAQGEVHLPEWRTAVQIRGRQPLYRHRPEPAQPIGIQAGEEQAKHRGDNGLQCLRELSEEWTSDLQRSAHPRHPAKRQGVPAGILWQGQRPRLQLQRTLQHQVCRITKRKHSFCTPRA